ncbi:MAG: hypothetical protein ACE14T_10880 [Syntrophales bacterium]
MDTHNPLWNFLSSLVRFQTEHSKNSIRLFQSAVEQLRFFQVPVRYHLDLEQYSHKRCPAEADAAARIEKENIFNTYWKWEVNL